MSTTLYKPTITEFESADQLYHYAEAFVIDEMLENIGEEGTFRLALPGGKSPVPLYRKLANNASLPWEEVELYQTDERFVPNSEVHSNQFSIAQELGEDVIGRVKSAYFMTTNGTVDEALTNYNEVIDALEEPFFDLSILGIGDDGHIASLFPNSDYLTHQPHPVIATRAPQQFEVAQRLSLTLETILNSKKILVLLNGITKADVLSELIGGEKRASEFPAKFLLAHPKLFILSYFPEDENQE